DEGFGIGVLVQAWPFTDLAGVDEDHADTGAMRTALQFSPPVADTRRGICPRGLVDHLSRHFRSPSATPRGRIMTHHADTLFIVTGAPGAGKTTLLDAAAREGIQIGREAARAVIQSQAAIGGPAVQWRNPAMFAELMLDRDIQSWQALR